MDKGRICNTRLHPNRTSVEHTITNCESDVFANIPSDHLIMTCTITTKLNGHQKANKTNNKYEQRNNKSKR